MEEVKKIIEKSYRPHEVFNLDQSRFDKRLNSYRTLAQKGDKRIYHNVGSTHASTHNYMLFPIISVTVLFIRRYTWKTRKLLVIFQLGAAVFQLFQQIF